MMRESGKGACRLGVCPRDPFDASRSGRVIEVARPALKFAETRPLDRDDCGHVDSGWWKIVDRRVTGLEHAPAFGRIGDDAAVELDAQTARRSLEAGRSRVGPDGFLLRADWIWSKS